MCKCLAIELLGCLMIMINIFFGILGLLFAAVGGVLMSGSDLIQGISENVLKAIPVLGQYAYDSNGGDAPPYLSVDELLQTAGIACVVIGGFLFFISVLGCCAGSCAKKVCLYVYLVLLILIFAIQLAFVVLFFLGQLQPLADEVLGKAITEHYNGIDSNETFSVVINFIQLEFECCGVNDYTIYNDTKEWTRTRQVSDGNGGTREVTEIVPLSCCKMMGTFPNVEPKYRNCTEAPTTESTWKDHLSKMRTMCMVIPVIHTLLYMGLLGCYEAIVNRLDEYSTIMFVVCVGALVIQFFLILSVFIILCLKKDDKEK